MTKYHVKNLGTVPIKEQALEAAKRKAAADGIAVEVTATFKDGRKRSILVHPDGHIEKLWK